MTKKNFSALERTNRLQEMTQETYDLLVVGGGITGAGIALDAATRGLKVALVEKHDFAWGTSSRSTKLIHGGLRYLKQLEIQLVREVGTERAIVHQNARHIVIPERMLLPIVEKGSLGKFTSSIGLWVYDFLAGVEDDEKRIMLNKAQTAKAEPLLRNNILKGGGLYYEYRTDDARLTIENMKSAVQHGANCINYAEVVEFTYDNGYVSGAIIQDNIGKSKHKIKAKSIINAAGPWVDSLRGIDTDGVKGKRLQLTKGIHVVVPHEKLPIKQAVYFDVEEDGRMVFAIPRGRITYVGTTDTVYNENINRPVATQKDVDYVLKAANYMFPSVNLETEDVISTWAGLRPLIYEEGKSASELSRKDEIFYSKSGLISIAGGKLTGYRKMAERVVNVAVKQLKEKHTDYDNIKDCVTKNLKVSGGDFESQEAVEQFLVRRIGEAKQIGATTQQVKDLVYRYGTNTDVIIEKAFEYYTDFQDPTERILAAEIWYGVHYEMVNNLNDFLIRRTGKLYFERDTLDKWYPFFANELAKLFNHSESDMWRDMGAFKKEYDEVLSFQAAKEPNLV